MSRSGLCRLLLCAILALALSCDIHMDQARESTVRMIEMPSEAVPLTRIMVIVNSGSVGDPPGKYGLSKFTADMIIHQELPPSGETCGESLRSLGSTFTADVRRNSTIFMCESLTEYADSSYGLIARALLEPSSSESTARKVKAERQESLEVLLDDPKALSGEILDGLLYNGTIYAHPVFGTTHDFNTLTAADADSMYASSYTLDDVTVCIGGNYPEELLARIETDFGTLPPSPPRKTITDVALIDPSSRIAMVQSDSNDSTTITIASLPVFLESDAFSLMIAEHYIRHRLLMFEGCRVLPQNLDRLRMELPTHMLITVECAGIYEAVYCIKAVVYELSRLSDMTAEPELLEHAKRVLLNSLPFAHETTFDRLYFMSRHSHSADSIAIPDYAQTVEAITAGQISEAVKMHWPDDGGMIVVATKDTARFNDILLEYSTLMTRPPDDTTGIATSYDTAIISHDLGLEAGDITNLNTSELF